MVYFPNGYTREAFGFGSNRAIFFFTLCLPSFLHSDIVLSPTRCANKRAGNAEKL